MYRAWMLTAVVLPLAAQQPPSDKPNHLFDPRGHLSAPSTQAPGDIALAFLRENAGQYGLSAQDLGAAGVAREYRTAHNGITHLTYRQNFQGVEVDNADWSINIDSAGRVINAGGWLAHAPAPGMQAPTAVQALAAVRAAARAVNPKLAERFAPLETRTPKGPGMRFAGSSFPADIEAIPVWWNYKDELRAAWKFGVTDDGLISYRVVVDTATGKILDKRPLTFGQSPRGLVWHQGSPQPNPTPGVALSTPPPVVERLQAPLTGDPVASPKGWITGTETAGNNVIAGTNTLGVNCTAALSCLDRPRTAVAPDGNFTFPIDVTANPAFFPDAAAVNLFYWVNKAHDWFYAVGFDEAAGNFQQDNFSRGGVDGDPMIAYALYGTAFPRTAKLNNAFFTTPVSNSDGSQGQLAFYLENTNGRFYDNSADAATVVHEYTHGVSNRLARNLYFSFQGAAMGEALSDFFALEFLTLAGAPPDGVYPFSEYPDQVWGLGIRTRPYSTRMDVNPLTFAALGHVLYFPEVHSDGEIFAQALWEARAALIQQFGESEGRRRIRLLVMDGMKLAPSVPSMLDMRDAILLADQVDFQGASQSQLWTAFAKRGMGVLALSNSADSIHIRPSYEVASPKASMAFYEDSYTITERIRIALQDANLTAPATTIQVRGGSGDLETVTMRRRGSIYYGFLDTDFAPVLRNNGRLELTAGDFITAFYTDANNGSGPAQISTTAPLAFDYDWYFKPNTTLRFSGERALRMQLVTESVYALPWPFPFFGKNYTQLWVHPNGLLTFDSPSFAACADGSGLLVSNGIAPLYMDLVVGGGAQSAEDVYVSTGPDSVTFRWAAETSPDFVGSRPEAVNFAATLFRDGRIQFNYGSGNRNLVGGSNFFGCNASSPTVGISNGHESFLETIPTHDGKGTLENAQTVLLDPPFNASSAPVIRLESPAPGDHVQGILSGKGVVYDPNPEGAIRGIDILIDGIAMDYADTGLSRADFCATNKVQDCPNVGFSFQIPLARFKLTPGPHTLQLVAINRRAYFVYAPADPMTFIVDPGEPTFGTAKVESPTPAQEVSGSITLRGYAYSDAYQVSAVDVLIDGVTAGRASYGTARTDICGSLTPAPANCPRIGWTYTLNTRLLTNGEHTLALRIIDSTGRYPAELQGSMQFSVNNAAQDPATGVIAAPAANQTVSGAMQVSGYAYAPAGRVSRVVLFVDGYQYANLTYGGARPEACSGLAGVSACPNIGFDGEFDTTRLVNGPHFLNIAVVDNAGNAAFVPATLVGGLNFTVKN